MIFSALAVAVCFKAGLFNIGVEGQYLIGMVTATWAALKLDFLPGPMLVIAVLVFAMLGGMFFAGIAGVLKVKTGAHEVVTTIMLNGIAVSFLAWALNGPLKFTEDSRRDRPAVGQVPRQRADPRDRLGVRHRPFGGPFAAAADRDRVRGARVVHVQAHAPRLRGPCRGVFARLGQGGRHLDRGRAD